MPTLTEVDVNNERQVETNAALTFVLAGNAIFTLKSGKTGSRYTYKVSRGKKSEYRPFWFVSLLTGPQNTNDFTYMGMIEDDKHFHLTRASKYTTDSIPVKAFEWVFSALARNAEPKNVEIWHAGRCCRCARPLTVPESIEAGIGPECASKM